MELKEAIKKRRSIRKFADKTVGRDTVKNLLFLANLAPSAGNLQAREFIVIDDEEKKKALAKASYNQHFIAEAPIVIVFCANEKRISPYGRRGKMYCIQDASAAVQNFLLAAVDAGLATCWVGAFDEDDVREILCLPHYIKPVAIVPLGHAAETPFQKELRSLEEMIHYNEW